MSRREAFEAGKASRTDPNYKVRRKFYPATSVLMVGDHPSGATSATIEGVPGLSSTVRVYKGKKNIGVLDAGNKIGHVQTHSEHQRKGVATLMDRLNNFEAGRQGYEPVAHASVRTPQGDAWAKKVGGDLPKREPSFGMNKSLLEDLK